MTIVNGQIRVDAAELGPEMQKLLQLLEDKQLPICIARGGHPLAHVVLTGELIPPDPRLKVRFSVAAGELTTPDDWREAGV